jgi:hypothetical protein
MTTTIHPRIIAQRKILHRPSRQPEHTRGNVGYDLGKCFQLDRDTCLLAAGMDEQGGGDLSVGNDAFVFRSLDEIREDRAIPLNGPEPEYCLKSTGQKVFLAKFPLTGGFIPLGAKCVDGREHPGAGTGLFFSVAMTFNADRSSAGADSEVVFEWMQVRWDGSRFTIEQRTLSDTLLGHRLKGPCISYFLDDHDGLLAPLTTSNGIVVFRFEFKDGHWQAVVAGKPFLTFRGGGALANLIGENEPSIQKRGDDYYIYTRGVDTVGRLYRSRDGLNYDFRTQRYNNAVPQVLNKGLDGSLYIATNPNMDMLRNPLVIYPLTERSFDLPNCTAEPLVIHDQDGIRNASGDSIPFVDHGVGVNLFLEGRRRHLLWYRVCDLKERTLHAFQTDLKAVLGKPKPRAAFGGLYVCELGWDTHPEDPSAFSRGQRTQRP